MKEFSLKILLVLSLGHLVTDIYQGALPTVLPFLKEKLSLSYTMTGIIFFAANVMSSLIQPLFGYISDRRKMAWLLIAGPLAAGFGLSFLSVPSGYETVLLLVIVSGSGIASFHPEGFKTASFFTGERKVTGMSFFSVGGSLGSAFAPIIVVYLVSYLGLERLPLMAVLSVGFVAVLMFHWREISGAAAPVKTSGAQHDSGRYPKGTYLSLAMLIAIITTRSSVQLGLMSYIPFYYINYLRGDPLYAGGLVFAFLIGGSAGTLAGGPIADRWGHKRYLIISLLLSVIIFPLIHIVKGGWLFPVMGVLGMILVSSFSVTIVMAQHILPRHLGIVSGLMVGFGIGTGGLWVTLLGVIADFFSVPVALKSIMILPAIGLVLSLFLKYPLQEESSRNDQLSEQGARTGAP